MCDRSASISIVPACICLQSAAAGEALLTVKTEGEIKGSMEEERTEMQREDEEERKTGMENALSNYQLDCQNIHVLWRTKSDVKIFP